MLIRGHNRLDSQLKLRPCDYAVDPHKFGRDAKAAFQIPVNGDAVSARAALMQHRMILRWREHGDSTGARLGSDWGFSKQTFSRTLLGQRWAGQLVTYAILEHLGRVRPTA